MVTILSLLFAFQIFASQGQKTQAVFDLFDQFSDHKISEEELSIGLCRNGATLLRSSLIQRKDWLKQHDEYNDYTFSVYQLYQLEFQSITALDYFLNYLSIHPTLKPFFGRYNLYAIKFRSLSGSITLTPRPEGIFISNTNDLNVDANSAVTYAKKSHMAFGYLLELSLINQSIVERFESLGFGRFGDLNDPALKLDLYLVLAAMGYKYSSSAKSDNFFVRASEAEIQNYRQTLFYYSNVNAIFNESELMPNNKTLRGFYLHYERYAALLKILGDKKLKPIVHSVEYYRTVQNWRLPAVFEDTLRFVENKYPGLIEQTVEEGRGVKWNFSDACTTALNPK